MQYSKEKLQELAKIAEEKGSYEGIALHIGISVNKLYDRRKKNPELEEVLAKAIEKYQSKHVTLKDHVFSEQELEEITQLVKEKNIESASIKYGVSAQVFNALRKNKPELDSAIIKGQKERKSDSLLNQALAMFREIESRESLNKITEIALDGGVEAVEKYYKVSPHILRRCRQEISNLNDAIKNALKKRPCGAAIPSIQSKIAKTKSEKKEHKSGKAYNTKRNTKKPPREIINKTMSGVADQTDDALAKFKKLMEERKRLEHRQRVISGEFKDML